MERAVDSDMPYSLLSSGKGKNRGVAQQVWRAITSSPDYSGRRPPKMVRKPMRIASLGSCLKPFLEPAARIPTKGHGYLVMIRNLLQLLQIGGRFTDHPKKRDFLSSLNPAETRVLYLIEEWWGGLIQEDLLSQVTKGVLFAYALWEIQMYDEEHGDVGFEQFLFEDEDKAAYEDVRAQVLETKDGPYYSCLAWRQMKERERGGGLVDDMILTERTTYNNQLFLLAKGELLLPDVPDELRNSIRGRAGVIAACQRVANESMGIGLRAVSSADQLGIPGQLVELSGQQIEIAIDTPKLQDPRVEKSLKECFWNPGASVNRCPWLGEPDPNDADDFGDLPPFYLWHIKDRKTTKVFGLDVMPRYAVISHTWGRWRTPGVNVAIKGVPWEVPTNSLFDVKTLPSLLEDAGFPEEYVWIDLFCIPQDRNNHAQQVICRMELMRQASIFHNAETAVAWIYDIEDWRPTAAALAYLANHFHNESTNKEGTELTPLYEMVLKATAEHANDACGLWKKLELEGEDESIGWFSSLWTLQESLMRPDMLLLNRNWKPLTVWNVTITLDTISSLVVLRHLSFNMNLPALEQLEIARQHEKGLPNGAMEIYNLFSNTGMVQLSDPSQLSALILGGKRVCKHSRSQAIMSVVGTTSWFTANDFKQFSHPETEDEMIFGLYEPEFIREVCRTIGGSFFMCRNEGVTVSNPDGTTRKDKFRTLNLVSGSMLPFSPGSAARFCNIPGKDRGFVDHPSVANWRVSVGRDVFTGFKGGDVFIPSAAVLAANCEFETTPLYSQDMVPSTSNKTKKVPARSRPLKGRIQGNPPPSGFDITKTVEIDMMDIDEWVAKFDDDTFAVCVMSTATEIHGVLLQRPGPGHGPLVKIGIFEVKEKSGIELPETSELNWTIV